MFRIHNYLCQGCNKEFEAMHEENEEVPCKHCGNKEVKKILCFGGYRIDGANDASTRPKRSGAFGGRKRS